LLSAFSITIAYRIVTSLPESGLLEDTIQGAWGEIIARFPGDGNASLLGVMLELTVAALRRGETPTVVVQHSQYLADLHRGSVSEPRPVLLAGAA
jgi:hypothetical protein